ncbi:ExbD/TolR family protein [Piscinibacter defluvii]|uniref:ExbD/TolR family protein n=1 Tax=Piscinibacter defluvii TaxID=1796922 RepID=UPI000FDF22F5|nr:biopolymer transporter ExbD [Piscinibacter defluvii]
MAIALACSACSQSAPPREAQLQVAEDGSYQLNMQPVEQPELKHQLQALRAAGAPVRLEIYAHPMAKHEAVGRAVKAAQDAGVDTLAFVTTPPPTVGVPPSTPAAQASRPQ